MAPRNNKTVSNLRQQPDLSFLNPYSLAASKESSGSLESPGSRTCLREDSEQANTDHNATPQRQRVNFPTPHSLIDPLSFNRQGITQLEALRQANVWFTGTLKVLDERTRLGEKMKKELGKLISSLENLERLKRELEEEGQQPVSCEVVSDSDTSSDTSSVNIIVDDLEAPTTFREQKAVDKSESTDSVESPEFIGDLLQSLPNIDDGKASSLDQLEQDIRETLRKIQVTRAKWNAGGRGLERWTGTR